MNDKKQIIQISIIVVAFSVAGIILYNGFFKSSSQQGITVGAVAGATANAQTVLPYGDNLNFDSVLHIQGFVYHQISYPVLDPSNDVGILTTNLIVPPASK